LDIAAYGNLVFDKDYAQSMIHKHHPVGTNNIDPYSMYREQMLSGGRCENRQGLLLVTTDSRIPDRFKWYRRSKE
jgi:hypothetical protein